MISIPEDKIPHIRDIVAGWLEQPVGRQTLQYIDDALISHEKKLEIVEQLVKEKQKIRKICDTCDQSGKCQTEKTKGDKDDTCMAWFPKFNRFRDIRAREMLRVQKGL